MSIRFLALAVGLSLILAAAVAASAAAVPPVCDDPTECEGGGGEGPRTITQRHTLEVERTAGTVTDGGTSGDVINCGTDCTREVTVTQECVDLECDPPVVQTVALTASPTGSGWSAVWGGCTSVSGNTCQVYMDRDRNVSLDWSDVSAPSVALTGPVADSRAGATVQASATASDNAGVARVEFLVGGVKVAEDTTFPYAASLALTGVHGQTRDIAARAVDTSSLSTTSASRTVTLDRQVALSLGSTPAANSHTNAASVPLQYTTDADVPAANRKCGLNGGTLTTCSSPYSPALAADGAYTYTVEVTDDVGNKATAVRAFTVDRTAPSAQFTDGPDEGATVSTSTFTMSFAVADASPLTTSCSVDGGAAGACTTATSHTLGGLTAGTHSLTVRTTDAAGNAKEITRTFAMQPAGTGTDTGAGADNTTTTPSAPVFLPLVSATYRTAGAKTTFSSLRVRNAPAGTKVQITCKGRGCPLRKKTFRVRNGKVNLLKLIRNKALRAGARLQIRVVGPAGDLKVVTYTMRRGKVPRQTIQCAAPGGRLGRCA